MPDIRPELGTLPAAPVESDAGGEPGRLAGEAFDRALIRLLDLLRVLEAVCEPLPSAVDA